MQEILGFIAQRRSIGQSDQDISNELLGAGWDPAMVSQSFQQSPPASVPHETIVAPAQPTDQFYPQQPQQPQQPQGRPYSPQPLQQPQARVAQPSQSAQQPLQPMPVLPRQTGKLPLIIISVVLLIILGIGGFLFFNQMGSSGSGTGNDDSAAAVERDSQRQAAAARLLAEAETQASLSNGRYPEANVDGWQELIGNFRDFDDPSTGSEYEFTTATPAAGQMQYANRVVCNEDRLAVGNERSIVMRVLLESGAIYCIDNT